MAFVGDGDGDALGFCLPRIASVSICSKGGEWPRGLDCVAPILWALVDSVISLKGALGLPVGFGTWGWFSVAAELSLD